MTGSTSAFATRANQRLTETPSYSIDQHRRRGQRGRADFQLARRLTIVRSRHPPTDGVLTGEQILPDGTVPRASPTMRRTTIRGVGANKANGFAFPRRAACRAAALNDPESVTASREQGHLP
jgi:hypothetical protein